MNKEQQELLEKEMPRVAKAKEMQAHADKYVELKSMESQFKKEADALKEKMRDYLNEHKRIPVSDTTKEIYDKSEVYMDTSSRTPSSSVYTKYDPDEVKDLINKDLISQVMEVRVNAEKLEQYVSDNLITADVTRFAKKSEQVSIKLKK